MNIVKAMFVCAVMATLSACATQVKNTQAPIATQLSTTSIQSPDQIAFASDANAPTAFAASPVTVTQVRVVVPETLKVSEANRYYPSADIIWREDPIGNRYEQVHKIMQDALERGTKPLNGAVPVRLYVELRRFHALTEKARFSIGGVHAIKFVYVLEDARTGARLTEPRIVEADLEAFGGDQAIEAMRQGQTQKVRITAHVAEVIRQELTRPAGYKNPQLGLIQAINKI